MVGEIARLDVRRVVVHEVHDPLVDVVGNDALERQIARLAEVEDLGVGEIGIAVVRAHGDYRNLSRMNSTPGPWSLVSSNITASSGNLMIRQPSCMASRTEA